MLDTIIHLAKILNFIEIFIEKNFFSVGEVLTVYIKKHSKICIFYNHMFNRIFHHHKIFIFY